jgi:hypothetical protein
MCLLPSLHGNRNAQSPARSPEYVPSLGRCQSGRVARSLLSLVHPTYTGVWYAAVHVALLLLLDTRLAQCPRPHRRSEALSVLRGGEAGPDHLSLSRFNHWLPRSPAHPEIVQGTAEVHHQITDACFPQTHAVFDAATALHTALDMVEPPPRLVERLVRQVLLPRAFLSQIEINSCVENSTSTPLRHLHPLHSIVFLSHGV